VPFKILYASMQAAQTPASKLRLVTPDKESSVNTFWQEGDFEQICSRESLTEKAVEFGKTISEKEHERERYNFDTTMFYEYRFWNRRPDHVLLCFIDPRVRKIRNEAFNCLGIFSRTLRFNYMWHSE